ncbi:MAG: acetylornithine/succinylornithine family transaminase [Clostridia bacterium]|nr:acetylornithine/succinylornithine family transaminase [Clostridia bacterium]
MNIFEKDSAFIAGTYARFPVELVSGKGSLVKDRNGKEYIDLSTGIAVNTFGIADSQWINAVTEQLTKIQHASNLYYTEPCVTLAELLCQRTGLKKVFFGNSGAEANECAIKVARKYAAEKKGKDYNVIITLKNSFHGRTITTLAATGQDVFHNDFLPLTEGFVYCEAGNIAQLESLVSSNKVCAIMFELVQGEGGVLPLSQEFVDAIFEIAEKNDILTICDEVQTGNGRTGALYGFMKYGVLPDIVSTAKGLGNGLPLGATMLGEKVKDVLTPSSHGSTFGGNPVACAGAISVINRIDEDLLKEVNKKSEFIVDSLEDAQGIKSVSGMGLMLGIETEKDAGEVIKYCMDNGVLVIKAKNKVRLLPALNIPFELLEKAVEVIKKGCAL